MADLKDYLRQKIVALCNKLKTQQIQQESLLKSPKYKNEPDLFNAINESNASLKKIVDQINNSLSSTDIDKISINQQNVRGNRGNTIAQCTLNIGDVESTVRSTTVNGKKYFYDKFRVNSPDGKDFSECTEIFENGELTLFELQSSAGSYEKFSRTLAYEKVPVASESGIPIMQYRRNPARDMISETRCDLENGQTSSLTRTICDEKGNAIGKFRRVDSEPNVDSSEPQRTSTTIERTFTKKDGTQISYKSIIECNGDGIYKRIDFENGQKLSEVVLNASNETMSITNFKDGEKSSFGRYQYHTSLDGSVEDIYTTKSAAFDNGVELSEDEIDDVIFKGPDEFAPSNFNDMSIEDVLYRPDLIAFQPQNMSEELKMLMSRERAIDPAISNISVDDLLEPKPTTQPNYNRGDQPGKDALDEM